MHLLSCVHACILADLSRMFLLVSRVPKGLEELRDRFENHVHSQGVAAVEKCGETALNVSQIFIIGIISCSLWPLLYSVCDGIPHAN